MRPTVSGRACRSAAIDDRSPIGANSVTTMVKVATARTAIASKRCGGETASRRAGAVQVDVTVGSVGVGGADGADETRSGVPDELRDPVGDGLRGVFEAVVADARETLDGRGREQRGEQRQ